MFRYQNTVPKNNSYGLNQVKKIDKYLKLIVSHHFRKHIDEFFFITIRLCESNSSEAIEDIASNSSRGHS